MEHTPKEEEKRLREEFINKIELDKMIKDIGYTGAKGTIADYWLKIRREAIAEERDNFKRIVREETPRHITREYRDTDSMADRICKRVSHLTQE